MISVSSSTVASGTCSAPKAKNIAQRKRIKAADAVIQQLLNAFAPILGEAFRHLHQVRHLVNAPQQIARRQFIDQQRFPGDLQRERVEPDQTAKRDRISIGTGVILRRVKTEQFERRYAVPVRQCR